MTVPRRRIATIVAGLAATFLAAAPARADDSAVTCTNVVSGTSWQIRIDYDKSTVDSYPAEITAGKIAWHNLSDGGNYTLDRKSGKLTMIVASSTGGYFLYYRCGMAN